MPEVVLPWSSRSFHRDDEQSRPQRSKGMLWNGPFLHKPSGVTLPTGNQKIDALSTRSHPNAKAEQAKTIKTKASKSKSRCKGKNTRKSRTRSKRKSRCRSKSGSSSKSKTLLKKDPTNGWKKVRLHEESPLVTPKNRSCKEGSPASLS